MGGELILDNIQTKYFLYWQTSLYNLTRHHHSYIKRSIFSDYLVELSGLNNNIFRSFISGGSMSINNGLNNLHKSGSRFVNDGI